MSVAEILDKAADLIEANGHWKGEATPGHRSVTDEARRAILAGAPCCTVGALYAAADEDAARETGPYLAFRDWLDCRGLGGMVLWNDAPERTQQEVVTALRKAAEANR